MDVLKKVIIIMGVVGIISVTSGLFLITNYIDSKNKITGELISSTIRVENYEVQFDDPYNFMYLSITDERDRGYFTQIGHDSLPKLKKGMEYDIVYFCDTINIRRIVTIIEHKPIKPDPKYTCDVGECKK